MQSKESCPVPPLDPRTQTVLLDPKLVFSILYPRRISLRYGKKVSCGHVLFTHFVFLQAKRQSSSVEKPVNSTANEQGQSLLNWDVSAISSSSAGHTFRQNPSLIQIKESGESSSEAATALEFSPKRDIAKVRKSVIHSGVLVS